MQISENDLVKDLISSYWNDFQEGGTWNYFTYPLRYHEKDTWASIQDWTIHASKCLKNKKNQIQALEVLLSIDYAEHVDDAETFLNKLDDDIHDVYYLYDLLAMMPKINPLRKRYLSRDSFDFFVQDDSDAHLARLALCRVQDEEFLSFAGSYVNHFVKENRDDYEEVEGVVFPLLVDLGKNLEAYLSEDTIGVIEFIINKYLEKDMLCFEDMLNGRIFSEDERCVWIADEVARIAFSAGFTEILDRLKLSDWYWAGMFSEIWEDSDNNNLLAWSLYGSNETLLNRAEWVMNKHEYQRLDGAIAFSRLSDKL